MARVNGAHALLHTLVAGGVDTCFMNPGTSEMHFVAALDGVPEMRGVLTLFEGVATGAADGYARMAERPAAVLLHLGPGLGNGVANLHNARRARSPVVTVVGDHATYHKQFDAPLESDIDALASNVSGWVRRSMKTEELPQDAADAIAHAYGPPGQVATLILPADVSWSDGAQPARPARSGVARPPDEGVVDEVARALRSGEPVGFLVGGRAGRAGVLEQVGALAAGRPAKVLCETFPARLERGAGRLDVERLAYLGERAMAQLEGLAHLVVVDAVSPVSFFAYPGKPSDLVPDGCRVHRLAGPADDVGAALDAVASVLGPGAVPTLASLERPGLPDGDDPLTADVLARTIGALLPEDAIVSDEANTSGLFIAGATAGAPPHDWLTLTGGAIGMGLPLATGAAVACPGRRVLALEADGSAMYTAQALWTMARESADVTVVILANRSYAILNMELRRVGAAAGGPRARSMLDLRDPELDFVSLAAGMGLPATRARTGGELADQLGRALATPGPSLVEAVISR
ncbi:MAG: acetolactate synthase large subunit [Acidimicrobiales bacterium]|nr:acetolactate synthase large subunit [Acidimicrobiales bacterium]